MEVKGNIKKSRGLKDFTRLLLGLCLCLFMLCLYQQMRLWQLGVIDSVFIKATALYLLHQLGFTAFVGLVLAFVFRLLESKVPALGFRTTLVFCTMILISEVWLVEYFIHQYELLDYSTFTGLPNINMSMSSMLSGVFLAVIIVGLFLGAYKITTSWHGIIGRMYPLTIVFFVMFLGTFFMEEQPINQNKVQYLVTDAIAQAFDVYEYTGQKEYPLLRPWSPTTGLDGYFKFTQKKPNVVLIVLEDLGADFVNQKGKYRGFTPFLDSLTSVSLHWDHFLSNTLDLESTIPSVLGSLPNGVSGFLRAESPVDRNTLFGLLKANGYRTAFYSGSNTSLTQLDKFLEQEQVDFTNDKSDFGAGYQLLRADKAGNISGYPDKEVYKKWKADFSPTESPRLDVFMLSSLQDMDLLPEKSTYLDILEHKMTNLGLSRESARFIEKNKDVFAARLYSDDALRQFFMDFKQEEQFKNTIFLITGNKNLQRPNAQRLASYHVPFIIYSPLLTSNTTFKTKASHQDIAPSLLSLLHNTFQFDMPQQMAWLGGDLISKKPKKIALYRNQGVLKDFIIENHFISSGTVYAIDEELALSGKRTATKDSLQADFKQFKAIDHYVVEQNKLLPDSLSLFKVSKRRFTNEEKVWIQSVFNGSNFDNAYATARSLAHKGNADRALLLCAYILSEVPGHIDAQILQGRIYAWSKEYAKSLATLEAAVKKYPHYQDAYAALLDVYFWSGKVTNYVWVAAQMERNAIESAQLDQKIERLKVLEQKINSQLSQLDFESTE